MGCEPARGRPRGGRLRRLRRPLRARPGALAKGLGWIGKKRRPEEPGFAEEAATRFRIVDTEDAFSAELGSCQVLLEVIFEDLDLKCDVLARLAPQLPPDGMVWTYMNNALVRIDPADATVSPVGKLAPGRIAFSGRDIYLSGTGSLRRVREVVKPDRHAPGANAHP